MQAEPLIPPLVASRDDAPAYWQGDILWLMLATGAQTNGQYALLEQLCREGSGPGPHQHTQHEALYLMEGTAEIHIGNQTVQAKAGAVVFIPRHTTHSFRITSPVARLLNTYAPAGFEEFVQQTAAPAAARTLPPPGQADKPQLPKDQLVALAAKCGMTMPELEK
ncbi:cupin domain-containing protein [Hymenobacter sp. H14-R3]|uniref:cupin domain-containing protein n=1 Tax=Hymenobacter sp. H14-R3 TaxID=3046308 RepID=UPI0024B9B5E5|nr:cupin domain-containing protein [Hymenobacter sp. H14-R3]MDJ0367475.1 cupin domain-containing protein [Hymenobacter sp. H14-R3]